MSVPTDTAPAAPGVLDLGGRRRRRRSPTAQRPVQRGLIYVGALAIIVLNSFPLYWMLITAFRDRASLLANRSLIPGPFSVESFERLFLTDTYLVMLRNTFAVSTAVTLLTLLTAPPIAYVLARHTGRGRTGVMFSVLVAYMLPEVLLIIPIYLMLSHARFGDSTLADSLPGVTLAVMAQSLPLGIWLMYTFFRGLPIELEEAARVDGANRRQVFSRILVPLARPGLLSVGIFAFIMGWTNYVVPMSMIQSDRRQLLSVGLTSLTDRFDTGYGEIMALSVIVVLPVVILVGVAGKQFVAGLTLGATKG